MGFLKRIVLFLLVNMLVVLTISVILRLLNVQPFLQAHGISYPDLIFFCVIWGFGGAFISLSLSRVMAKWLMGVRVIDPSIADAQSQELVRMVYSLSRNAGLSTMPEVGIYESREVNAFATGPSRRRSLVAVSRGLLAKLSKEELEGVLGHEIAHIANGDMVTMTLLQGVINAFVMFLARILAFAFSGLGNKNQQNRSSTGSYYMLVFVFELVFMVLGMLAIAAYSRYREFRADLGGARLAGTQKMISALTALKETLQITDKRYEKPALQAFKISSPKEGSIRHLFSTHPSLEARIERLAHLANEQRT